MTFRRNVVLPTSNGYVPTSYSTNQYQQNGYQSHHESQSNILNNGYSASKQSYDASQSNSPNGYSTYSQSNSPTGYKQSYEPIPPSSLHSTIRQARKLSLKHSPIISDDTLKLTRLGSEKSQWNDDDSHSSIKQTINQTIKPAHLSAVFNLSNIVLGSGIIGIPLSVYQVGTVAGPLMLIFLAILTVYSLKLMIEASYLVKSINESNNQSNYQSNNQTRPQSLDQLMYVCYGKIGRIISLLTVIFLDFGVVITLLIVVGDVLPSVLSINLFINQSINRAIVLSFCTFSIVLPLCLKKNIESLAWSSVVSLVSVAGLVAIVSYRAIGLLITGHIDQSINQSNNQFISHSLDHSMNQSIHRLINQSFTFFGPALSQGIGSMSFVFVCHDVAFDVYTSLPRSVNQTIKQSINQWTGVAAIAIILALLPMLMMGFFCVIAFNQSTDQSIESNILSNFSMNDQAINFSRFALGLSMLLTLPANAHAAREAIKQLIPQSNDQSNNQSINQRIKSDLVHNVVTVGMLLSALMIAIAFDELAVIQSMIGSFCSVTLAFILPASAAIRARQLNQPVKLLTGKGKFELIKQSINQTNFGPWCLLSVGMIILINAIIQLFVG